VGAILFSDESRKQVAGIQQILDILGEEAIEKYGL
jgi:hypothetical protein